MTDHGTRWDIAATVTALVAVVLFTTGCAYFWPFAIIGGFTFASVLVIVAWTVLKEADDAAQ